MSQAAEPAHFSVPPIVKQITVSRTVEDAFRLFTAEIGQWWPLHSHSAGKAKAVSMALESGVGGRLFERDGDGQDTLWGTVTAWDPPHGLTCTWHPGRGADTAQQISVRFTSEGDGRTRVELTHSGWEATPEAERMRDAYNGGWVAVFETAFGNYADR
jgi:uncharacterized protein YndB with AHSA1/START domain